MAAPRGNKNALRHGLYANRISSEETKRLGKTQIKSLEGDIAYARVVISRIALILEKNGLAFKSTTALDDKTLKTLSSLSEAMTNLNTFIRTHAQLSGNLMGSESEIEEGKQLARRYLGVYEYLQPTATQKPKRTGTKG